MTPPAPLLLAVLAGVVALAAGCGGDPVASFREHGLRPLEQRVDGQRARLAALLRGIRPGSKAGARALRLQAAPLADAARRLAALHPPSGVEKATRAYATATAGLAATVRRFATALQTGATSAIRHGATAVRAAVGALQQARITVDRAVAR